MPIVQSSASSNLEKILELLKTSDLSLEDSEDFSHALRFADEAHLERMFQLFSEDGSSIERVYKNYQPKRSLLESGDSAQLEALLQEENSLLEE
jgi:hypothetical protein